MCVCVCVCVHCVLNMCACRLLLSIIYVVIWLQVINNSGPEVRDRVLKEVEILHSCSSCNNFLKIEDFFETSEK